MNKIIKQHYPAAKLPQDLREGIDPAGSVTVTITPEERGPRRILTLEDVQRRFPNGTVTADEAAQRVRKLRDEWDD